MLRIVLSHSRITLRLNRIITHLRIQMNLLRYRRAHRHLLRLSFSLPRPNQANPLRHLTTRLNSSLRRNLLITNMTLRNNSRLQRRIIPAHRLRISINPNHTRLIPRPRRTIMSPRNPHTRHRHRSTRRRNRTRSDPSPTNHDHARPISHPQSSITNQADPQSQDRSEPVPPSLQCPHRKPQPDTHYPCRQAGPTPPKTHRTRSPSIPPHHTHR